MGRTFDGSIFKHKTVKESEAVRTKTNGKSGKIMLADMFSAKYDGKFNLGKYFRSYYRDVIKQTEIFKRVFKTA